MRRLHVFALIALSLIGVLASVGSAGAAPTDPWVYKRTIGEDLNLQFGRMAVNYATGNILVLANGEIHQLDPEGKPVEFPAIGTSTIPSNRSFVVDNSGGPTQGNIYILVLNYESPVFETEIRAYRPDGSPFGEGLGGPGVYYPSSEAFNAYPCGIGMGPDGNLWLGSGGEEATELTPTGALTGRSMTTGGRGVACSLLFDDIGNVYVDNTLRFDVESDFTYLGNTNLIGGAFFGSSAIDPATHEVYNSESGIMAAAPTVPPAPMTPYEPLSSKFGVGEFSGGRIAGLGFSASGQTLYFTELNKIRVFHREPPSAPFDLTPSTALQVRSQAAIMLADMSAGGAPVTYHFELGTDTTYGQSTDPTATPFNYYSTSVRGVVAGLQPNTTYHVRLVATNSAGTTYGPDGTFRTYPASLGGGVDPCPNALARKQTVAQRLPDCRAYELASAADTGGYDVESYLSPGQTPLPGFPMATDKLLYAVHSGAVPGPWSATNHGPDPYLATRTANGWTTDYKGLPSDINPAAGSFSSVLGEADSQLNNLAFAGTNLCDPCFTDGGLRTGIPVRLANGQLVQGMSGSLAGSVPDTAKPEGKVAKYFSEDGRHLIFASKYAFEPGANTGGDLTVYDRNLGTGTTQIVSTDPAGNALTGTISELDVSNDGSRVVIGKGVSVDPQGNEYVHPYMHIGSSPNSVDLAPGTTSGVLYAGMTGDGSKVFFTSADKLIAGDTDAGADLYEADVDGSGTLELKLISDVNSDACSPVANSNGSHWNTTGANVDCSAVAISGGGGVASGNGALYFLSPESFGGEGTANQPNLYLATPGGSPSFVATLEPDNPLVLDSVKANAVRKTADFQTTPNGGFAAFASQLTLSGLSTHGLRSVYRYAANSKQLACASCDRTETTDSRIFAAADLPPNGLALLADGRLFFTTSAQLLLNDANEKRDVYEWSNGVPALISSGSGPFDSGLLSASDDGTDVFFFTQDNLATEEDRNGAQMRIYDAREGGGFFKLPPTVPCQASDECHGAGTPQPSPADIKSSGKTTQGNVVVCAKNRVKKRGKCVKKKAHAKKKHAKKKKGAAKKRNAATNGKRGGRNA